MPAGSGPSHAPQTTASRPAPRREWPCLPETPPEDSDTTPDPDLSASIPAPARHAAPRGHGPPDDRFQTPENLARFRRGGRCLGDSSLISREGGALLERKLGRLSHLWWIRPDTAIEGNGHGMPHHPVGERVRFLHQIRRLHRGRIKPALQIHGLDEQIIREPLPAQAHRNNRGREHSFTSFRG